MATSVGSVVFEISANIKDIQGQLRALEGQFQTSFNKISSIGKSALGSLGLGLSVGSIVFFSKSVVDLATHLKDLEDQTGLSAVTLSGLQTTIENSGISVDDFAQGYVRLVKGISQGDPEMSRANKRLEQLGFSAAEIKNAVKDPDKFLGELAKKINQFPDDRLRIGLDLAAKSGAKFGAALAQVAKDFDTLKTSGLTREQLESLDKFADDLHSITRSLQIIAALPLSDLASVFRALTGTTIPTDTIKSLDARIEAFQNILKRQISELPKAQQETFNTAAPQLTPEIKATSDALEALIEQRKKLAGTKPPKFTPDLADPGKVKALEDAIESYRKKLEAAIAKQEEEKVKLLFGEDAARQVAQAYDVLALKTELVAKKLPIPPDLAVEAIRAEATLRAFGVSTALVGEKDLKKLRDGSEEAAVSVKGLKLTVEQLLPALDELDKEFGQDLDKAKEKTNDVGRAMEALSDGIAAAIEKAKLLGPSFSLTEAISSETQRAIETLAGIRNSPEARARGAELAKQLPGQKIEAIDADTKKQLEDAAKTAQALGTAFDLPAEQVNILTSAIQRLVKEGIDPLDPKIQDLKKQLEDAKLGDIFARGFEQGIDRVFDLLDELANRQIKTFKDLFKALEDTALKTLSDISRQIIRNAINQQVTQATGGVGGIQGVLATLFPNVFGVQTGQGATTRQGGGLSTGPLTLPTSGQQISFPNVPSGNSPTVITAVQAIQSTSSSAASAMQAEAKIIEQTITGMETQFSVAIKAAAQAEVGIAGHAIGEVERVAIEAIKEAAKKASSSGGGGLPGLGGGGLPGMDMGGGGNPLSSLFGMFGSSPATSSYGALASDYAGSSTSGLLESGMSALAFVEHSGGIVGKSGTPRMVRLPLVVPRYHSGLNVASDERLAILQTGERVIPRGGRGGDMNVTIHIHQPNMSDRTSMSQIKQDIAWAVRDANRRHA